MDFVQYVIQEGLILVPAFWFIGWMIKGVGKIDNAWIPFILTALGIAFVPWYLGGYTPENFIQAILIVATAVLGDQYIKQAENIKEYDLNDKTSQ